MSCDVGDCYFGSADHRAGRIADCSHDAARSHSRLGKRIMDGTYPHQGEQDQDQRELLCCGAHDSCSVMAAAQYDEAVPCISGPSGGLRMKVALLGRRCLHPCWSFPDAHTPVPASRRLGLCLPALRRPPPGTQAYTASWPLEDAQSPWRPVATLPGSPKPQGRVGCWLPPSGTRSTKRLQRAPASLLCAFLSRGNFRRVSREVPRRSDFSTASFGVSRWNHRNREPNTGTTMSCPGLG